MVFSILEKGKCFVKKNGKRPSGRNQPNGPAAAQFSHTTAAQHPPRPSSLSLTPTGGTHLSTVVSPNRGRALATPAIAPRAIKATIRPRRSPYLFPSLPSPLPPPKTIDSAAGLPVFIAARRRLPPVRTEVPGQLRRLPPLSCTPLHSPLSALSRGQLVTPICPADSRVHR